MACTTHPSIDFLTGLKSCGIQVTREAELVSRMGEARNWQYAFSTLVQHGKQLGITFSPVGKKPSKNRIAGLLTRFSFSPNLRAACLACF